MPVTLNQRVKHDDWLLGKDGAVLAAAAHGNTDLVRELLDTGANAGVSSGNGYTPLHRAAQHGHLDVVRLLLERGADARPTANGGVTPIDLADQNSHAGIVTLLERA